MTLSEITDKAARLYDRREDADFQERIRKAAAKLLEEKGPVKARNIVKGALRYALRSAEESSGQEVRTAENAAFFHREVLQALDELSEVGS